MSFSVVRLSARRFFLFAVFAVIAAGVSAQDDPPPDDGEGGGDIGGTGGIVNYVWSGNYDVTGGFFLSSFLLPGDPIISGVATGVFSGSGDLHATAGKFFLSGANTFEGNFYVGDQATVTSDDAFGAAGNAVNLTGGVLSQTSGTFSFLRKTSSTTSDYVSVVVPSDLVITHPLHITSAGGGISVTGGTLTWSGAVGGDGSWSKLGTGTLVLNNTTNTQTGLFQLAAGTVQLDNAGALSGAAAHTVDAALDLNGYAPTLGTLSGGGTIAMNDTLSTPGGPTVNQTADGTFSGTISGFGAVTKTGAATLTLSGANTYAGGTTISAGKLVLGHENGVGTTGIVAIGSGATFDTAGYGFDLARLAGTGTATGSGVFSYAGAGDQSLSVALTGSGSLAKSGAGTLTLGGAGTYSGVTVVSAGTLRAGAANVLSSGSSLFVLNGGTLDLAGHDQTIKDLDSYNFGTSTIESGGIVQLGGGTLTNLTSTTNNWAGSIQGSGTFVKEGVATQKWYSANTFTGELQVNAGMLSAQADGVLSANAAVSIASGATFDLNSFAQATAGLAGAGNVALGSAMLTLNQATDTTFSGVLSGTGALTKAGAGALTLAGAATYTGGTTISGGTLVLGHANGVGPSGVVTVGSGAVLNAGTFGFDLARLTGAGTVTGSGAFSYSGGGDLTLAIALRGTGPLVKAGAGALMLSGANDFSGGVTLAVGTLRAGHGSALGMGTVRVDGGTLDLNGLAIGNALDVRGGALTGLANYTGTQTLRASVSYSGNVGGTLLVANGGALDTTGAVFTGAATVQSGGSLSGTGTLASLSVQSGGTLSPGNSPGLLIIGGDLTLAGMTQMELAGWGTRGTDYDAIDVGGALTFGGTLEVALLNGFSPTSGQSFDLFDFNAANASGTFSSLSLPSLGSGLEWNLGSLYTTGEISVAASAVPEPSTYAAIFGAGALGFAAWRRRFWSAATRRHSW